MKPVRMFVADDGRAFPTAIECREYEAEVAFRSAVAAQFGGRVPPDAVRWLLRNYVLVPRHANPS